MNYGDKDELASKCDLWDDLNKTLGKERFEKYLEYLWKKGSSSLIGSFMQATEEQHKEAIRFAIEGQKE
jgi:hypothetical protein